MTNEEAIVFGKRVIGLGLNDETQAFCELAIEALQERKTGKWIITARNGILCSECKSGTRKMPMLFGNPLYKYCPFCGAKMEVDDADSN